MKTRVQGGRVQNPGRRAVVDRLVLAVMVVLGVVALHGLNPDHSACTVPQTTLTSAADRSLLAVGATITDASAVRAVTKPLTAALTSTSTGPAEAAGLSATVLVLTALHGGPPDDDCPGVLAIAIIGLLVAAARVTTAVRASPSTSSRSDSLRSRGSPFPPAFSLATLCQLRT